MKGTPLSLLMQNSSQYEYSYAELVNAFHAGSQPQVGRL
jgi:hypothetical protein